jgi:hypothetical protein
MAAWYREMKICVARCGGLGKQMIYVQNSNQLKFRRKRYEDTNLRITKKASR